MKVCVYGVGAIGGLIGYRLAKAGHELSGVARGSTLSALRAQGLRMEEEKSIGSVAISVSTDPENLGVQNLVILAVKAPALAAAASRIQPLLGPNTVVLTAMNGVPWWFFRGSSFGGRLAGQSLDSVDPGQAIASAIPDRSVLGCVVHLGASCPQPGLVKALPQRKLIVGEPSGEMTQRLAGIVQALREAGFDAESTDSIQREIWYKLWGNMTMNPISALTGATMDRIIADPQVQRFCIDIMNEAKCIGQLIGCPIEESAEDRMEISRTLGAFKTSMLQDVEAGRPIELDAIVSAVREIGQLVGLPTPTIDILLGLTRLKARIAGLYPA